MDNYGETFSQPPEKRQRVGDLGGGVSTILLVPSHLLPSLVGKGGSNVRQLEQTSGARIACEKIDRGEDRGVEVSGPSASIGEAVRLISEMIRNALGLGVTTIKLAVEVVYSPV